MGVYVAKVTCVGIPPPRARVCDMSTYQRLFAHGILTGGVGAERTLILHKLGEAMIELSFDLESVSLSTLFAADRRTIRAASVSSSLAPTTASLVRESRSRATAHCIRTSAISMSRYADGIELGLNKVCLRCGTRCERRRRNLVIVRNLDYLIINLACRTPSRVTLTHIEFSFVADAGEDLKSKAAVKCSRDTCGTCATGVLYTPATPPSELTNLGKRSCSPH